MSKQCGDEETISYGANEYGEPYKCMLTAGHDGWHVHQDAGVHMAWPEREPVVVSESAADGPSAEAWEMMGNLGRYEALLLADRFPSLPSLIEPGSRISFPLLAPLHARDTG